jgi:SPP1 gp7 family putative phage head morphogenesis protein
VKKRPPANPDAFTEAVAWFRERIILTDDEFKALSEQSYHRAFTIAGVAQLDMVTQAWEALDNAISQGETISDFQATMNERLAAAWGKDQPWRVETIFRTNTQTAYSEGRWEQMEHPAVKEARPYRKFSAIMDQRTSPICAPLDGTVLPADDPFWESHNPPLHFNCRSHVVTLSEEEAKAEGVDREAPTTEAADGFGSAPSGEWVAPDADLAGYPMPLVSEYRRTG